MDRSRLLLSPGLWLDARRAVWLADEGVLAVADLHLGYAWSHRARGNLLPLSAREDSVERLVELMEDYAPGHVVLLGDIVHRADFLPALAEELTQLCTLITARAQLHFIRGNHDHFLPQLLQSIGHLGALAEDFQAGPHCLLHGDGGDSEALLASVAARGGRLIFGHEHPAIALSDGAMAAAKVPCFLAAPQALVLPAFSRWAAGCDVRRGTFLSALAQTIPWEMAYPILAGKLLPIRLPEKAA